MAVPTPANNWDGWGPPPGNPSDYYLDRDGNTTGVKGWIYKGGAGGGVNGGGGGGFGGGAGFGDAGVSLPSAGGNTSNLGGLSAGGGGRERTEWGQKYGPYLDMSPVDSQGLASQRPNYQQKFSKLQNVVFRKGFLRSRPGVAEVEPDNLPITGQSRPLAIFELDNPGSTVNRASYDLDITTRDTPTNFEILHPISDYENNGWDRSDGSTSNLWAFINSDEGDATNYINNQATGAITDFTVNLEAPTLTGVQYVLLHIILAQGSGVVSASAVTGSVLDSTGATVATAINFTSAGNGGQGTETHRCGFAATGVDEVDLGTSPKIKISTGAGADAHVRVHSVQLWLFNDLPHVPIADVATGNWTTTPLFSKIDDVTTGADDIRSATPLNQIVSWTIASFSSAPNGIQLVANLSIPYTASATGTGTARLRLKDSVGNVIATCDTLTFAFKTSYSISYLIHNIFYTNEFTHVAFTQADLTGATLEFECLSETTTNRIEIEQAWVQEIDAPGVDLIQVRDCDGTLAGNGIPGKARLMVADRNFIRMDDETSATGFTDVRGTVPNIEHINVDVGFLYGQAYIANGCQDTLVYPNSSNVFFALTGKPRGRTVAGFADRILLGWTYFEGNTVPERIIFSALNDGQDFTGSGSGDMDIINTPGGIIKLLPLTEDFCACYKQQGIYNLRRTGDAAAPLVPDLVDGETGCLALRSVVAGVTQNGSPVHYFLGRNSLSGINVFAYDGSQTQAVGDAITGFIEDRLNIPAASLSFFGIDPEGQNLWCFLPLDNEAFPTHAFSMNIRNNQWTGPHVFEHRYSTLGRWSFAGQAQALTGRPRLMWGRLDDGFPYQTDYDQGYDTGEVRDSTDIEDNSNFVQVVETGDLRWNDPQLNSITYRVHVHYLDKGQFSCVADTSTDGGITYGDATDEQFFGTAAGNGEYSKGFIDVPITQAPRVRIRLTLTARGNYVQPPIQLAEMLVETRPGSDEP